MDLSRLPIGENPPQDVNIIIEIPVGSEPVKYEFDKASGLLVVDRIMHTAMRYPANYGFIPHTLGSDGDPLDALVVSGVPFVPGCVVRARPVGVLLMEDQAGGDEKLLMVPVDALHPYYTGVTTYTDLPPIVIEQIEHFFAHYKDLEAGKWVKVEGWAGPDVAERLILEGIDRAKK
ncbi:MAG: inorganic diphosphatase [Alphaproteobacteria bacterium]|nr:inorganic diphosphatase [Alphaproteobacteria bacterium]